MDGSSRQSKMDSSSRSNRRGSLLGGKFKMSIRNLVGSPTGKNSSSNAAAAAAANNSTSSNTPSRAIAATATATTTTTTTTSNNKAGKNNNNNNNGGSTTPTPIGGSKKLRMLRGGSIRNLTVRAGSIRNLNRSSHNASYTTSMDLDDIMEPSAKALQQQQQKEHNLMSASMSAAATTSTDGRPISIRRITSTGSSTHQPPRATPPLAPKPAPAQAPPPPQSKPNSGSEMRQRLQAIEAMMAQGKAEMEMLKGEECIKIQALVRGFLYRRSDTNNNTADIQQQQQKPKRQPSKQNNTSKSTSTKPPLKSASSTNSKKGSATAAAAAAAKKKRKRIKQTISNESSDDPKESSLSNRKKEAAATKIQTLARGYLHRTMPSANITTSAIATKSSSKHKKGPFKKVSRDASTSHLHTSNTNPNRGGDRYTWDGSGNGADNDHYAWEEQSQSQDHRNHNHNSNKDKDDQTRRRRDHQTHETAPSHKWDAKKPSAAPNSKSSSNSSKTANNGKSKAKRVTSLKNNNNNNNNITTGAGSMKDQSMKDASMVDQSMYLHELEANTNKKSSSSGSMSLTLERATNPNYSNSHGMTNSTTSSGGMMSSSGLAVAPEHPDEDLELDASNDNVFEDSTEASDAKEDIASLLSSRSNQSLRSQHSYLSHGRGSLAGSMMSRLTDDDDGLLEEGDNRSSSSQEQEGYLLDDESSSGASEDLLSLSLSVMATAPKTTGHALKQLRGVPNQKNNAYLKDNSSSSKRRNDNTSRSHHKHQQYQEEDESSVSGEGGTVTDDDVSDDSRSSYAYAPRYNKNKKGSGHTNIVINDDTDDSVMAVAAEISDWEGESESEYDGNDNDGDISAYDDYDDDGEDSEDYPDDSVMAVALAGDIDYEDEDDDEDEHHNPREDDMSITSCETDLPKETYRRGRDRRHRRQRRRSRDAYEEEDDIIDAEDVSVLSTGSNKRHKQHHQKSQPKARRQSRKFSKQQQQHHNNDTLNLLGQYSNDNSESDEEDLLRDRKRRQRRRSRKSMKQDEEVALQNRLAEVNRLISESQQEVEELKDLEATKIQAFVRMHQERAVMYSSGRSLKVMRSALSRIGTKPMNVAAETIQALARAFLIRTPSVEEPSTRKRTLKVRKKRAQEEPPTDTNDEDTEAKLHKRLEEVEQEMWRCQEALEIQNATKLQALTRGVLQRSKDALNPEKVAAVKIQRLVRCVLRLINLRKKLLAISEGKTKELEIITEKRKAAIVEYEPGKFDRMDNVVKLVNFLKKQLEKENETAEKLVTKIKAIKQENIILRTDNSADVCTAARREIENEALEDKRKALTKLNQTWIDGIDEYKGRLERVESNIKLHRYQKDVAEKYIFNVVDLLDEKCGNKRLLKEIKFLANHTEVMGESCRTDDAVNLPM